MLSGPVRSRPAIGSKVGGRAPTSSEFRIGLRVVNYNATTAPVLSPGWIGLRDVGGRTTILTRVKLPREECQKSKLPILRINGTRSPAVPPGQVRSAAECLCRRRTPTILKTNP